MLDLEKCRAEAEVIERLHWMPEISQAIRDLCDEVEELRNIRLHSPDVTTMCVCPDCGASTRAARHLDIDCETIKDLRAQLATARNDALEEAARRVDCLRYCVIENSGGFANNWRDATPSECAGKLRAMKEGKNGNA